jgi:hypothetical protein
MHRLTYKFKSTHREPIAYGGQKSVQLVRLEDAVSPNVKAPERIFIDLSSSSDINDEVFRDLVMNQGIIRIWIDE